MADSQRGQAFEPIAVRMSGSPTNRASIGVRSAVGAELIRWLVGDGAIRGLGEWFWVGEALEPPGQLGGGSGRVQGAVFEGHGDGVWHVHSAGMRVLQRGGKVAPVGVRHQARVDSGSLLELTYQPAGFAASLLPDGDTAPRTVRLWSE